MVAAIALNAVFAELAHGNSDRRRGTDAVEATFRASDGAEVYLTSVSMVSAPAAERRLAGVLKVSLDSGYTKFKEGAVTDSGRTVGRWVALKSLAKGELIVIRNRQRLELNGGAAGIVWDFVTSPHEATPPAKP